MDYNDSYEQEIDLKELMFAVLHKWKLILAFGVIAALILGGIKGESAYLSENRPEAKKEAQETYQRELASYQEQVASYEKEIENLETSITEQNDYLENSVLMNISPYDVWEASAVVFVKADDDGKSDLLFQNMALTSAALQSYRSSLSSAQFLEKIASEVGIESKYLRELITITVGKADDGLNPLDGFYPLLVIQIQCGEEALAQEILDQILNGMSRFKGQIQAAVGEHVIHEVSRSLGTKVDLDLDGRQKLQRERLTGMVNARNLKKEEYKKLEEPKNVSASSGVVAIGIKYGLIGGVLGAFAVVFCICVAFVMSDKVYSPKELKYRFKLKLLGALPAERDKEEGRVDKWLNRMEGRRQNLDEEAEYSLILANLNNYIGEAKSLLVIGGAREEWLARVAARLAERLAGVTVVCGGNLLHDAQGLQKLPACDGVVLVEECGRSKYSNVELEIEKVGDMDKKILGCVVFE